MTGYLAIAWDNTGFIYSAISGTSGLLRIPRVYFDAESSGISSNPEVSVVNLIPSTGNISRTGGGWTANRSNPQQSCNGMSADYKNIYTVRLRSRGNFCELKTTHHVQ